MALICTVTDMKHWQPFPLRAIWRVWVCVLCFAGGGCGAWPSIVTPHHFPVCFREWFTQKSVVCVCTYMHTVWYVCTRLCCFFFSQKNARGDQIICVCVCACVFHAGGMPAPEQSPVTEERLLLTIRDSSTGRNMEADNTANNILASVKEQVVCLFCWHFAKNPPISHITALFKLFMNHFVKWHLQNAKLSNDSQILPRRNPSGKACGLFFPATLCHEPCCHSNHTTYLCSTELAAESCHLSVCGTMKRFFICL